MNNFEENLINYLLQFKEKPASDLTHALKMIGGENATMTDGMLKIVKKLINNKKRQVIIASVIALAVGSMGTAIYFKYKEKKKYEEECQKIIETLESEIVLANSDINNIAKESSQYR